MPTEYVTLSGIVSARHNALEKEVRLSMKRIASFLLAFMMMVSLTACGEGGLNLNPKGNEDDSDVKSGYIGDTMSTEWFDFVVNDAYSCSEYHGYTPQAGNKLVVADMSLKNNCGESVDMWGEDFVIIWEISDEDIDMDIPLSAGISDDQFPDEYVLGINATKSGVLVFEVPEEYRDFSIGFAEIFESNDDPDGDLGNTYFVNFTAEEK